MVRRMLVLALVAGCASLTVGTTLPAPAPAAAVVDTCPEFDLTDAEAVTERADAASAVFVGKVRSVRELRDRSAEGRRQDRPRRPAGFVHRITVVVDLREDVGVSEALVETEPGVDDGLGRLAVGATYVFFADTVAGSERLTATRCGGTTLLRGGLDVRLERDLQRILDDAEEPTPVEVALTTPASGTDEPPSLGRAAAPGVAIGLFGFLGLLLFWRLGARRP